MKFFLIVFTIAFSYVFNAFAQGAEICSFDANAKAISVDRKDFIVTYPNPKGNIELPKKVKQFVDKVSFDVFKNSLKHSPKLIMP